MLRLPRFRYLRPKSARAAARMAADLGPKAMFVAGGTDLFPKLKRRQFDVDALIGLDFLDRTVGTDYVGAGATLADVAKIMIYMVDYDQKALEALTTAAIEEYGADFPVTASTLVGVATLWQPDVLVEIDAVAVC